MAVLDETVELKHFYGDALVFGQHFEDFKWQSWNFACYSVGSDVDHAVGFRYMSEHVWVIEFVDQQNLKKTRFLLENKNVSTKNSIMRVKQ